MRHLTSRVGTADRIAASDDGVKARDELAPRHRSSPVRTTSVPEGLLTPMGCRGRGQDIGNERSAESNDLLAKLLLRGSEQAIVMLGVLSKMDNNAPVSRSFGLGHHAE